MVCTKISALGDEERSGDGGGIWEKRGGTVNAEDEVDAAGVTWDCSHMIKLKDKDTKLSTAKYQLIYIRT